MCQWPGCFENFGACGDSRLRRRGFVRAACSCIAVLWGQRGGEVKEAFSRRGRLGGAPAWEA